MIANVKINGIYFSLACLLFATEVCIALFVRDDFVRPYVGDILVVMLMYCFFKSFFEIAALKAIAAVLAFSFLIEVLQYFNIVEKLDLEQNKFARTVLGSSFSWIDILCYIIGAAIIVIAEKALRKRHEE